MQQLRFHVFCSYFFKYFVKKIFSQCCFQKFNKAASEIYMTSCGVHLFLIHFYPLGAPCVPPLTQ